MKLSITKTVAATISLLIASTSGLAAPPKPIVAAPVKLKPTLLRLKFKAGETVQLQASLHLHITAEKGTSAEPIEVVGETVLMMNSFACFEL